MEQSIESGLVFLADEQLSDGSFASYSSAQPNSFGQAHVYPAVFPSTLILSALSTIPETSAIRNRLADFLLKERSQFWSFNYWKRKSALATSQPYPDDLDDTFCALAALTLHDPKLIDASTLAHVVSLLTAVEVQEGGPYKTWLVPPEADDHWKDVDVVVNSNVAYFLQLQEIDLPNITNLIEAAITAEQYTSPYYATMHPIVYCLARWYRGSKQNTLREYIVAQQETDGSWGNPLYTALAVSALLRLGTSPEQVTKSIAFLVETQRPDGGWPAQAFCLDPSRKGTPYYAGSEALTTAFCIEALQHYIQTTTVQRLSLSIPQSQAQQVAQSITEKLRLRFSQLDESLQLPAEQLLHRVMTKDRDQQIALLPYYMSEALNAPNNDLAISLGQMNVCGWMAYTIYDDFLDGTGNTQLLSVANVCLRELLALSTATTPTILHLATLTHTMLDTIDSANAWEVAHCRLTATQLATFNLNMVPDYGDLSPLANKSLGHALGPVALLLAQGYKLESVEIKQLLTAFRHYLIARQMNDDAHDWKEDIGHGHINAVAATVIRDYAKGHVFESLDPATLEHLEQFLWEHTIVKICSQVIDHIHQARQLFTSLPMITTPTPVTQFFDAVEQTAERTLEEREQTMQFIRTYSRANESA